jgi:hypothetical protein
MSEKCPIKFSHTIATSAVIEGFFYMPQSCDIGPTALLPSEGRHGEDFFARKIRRLRPCLNPRIWVPEASMLTTRPPKPLYYGPTGSIGWQQNDDKIDNNDKSYFEVWKYVFQ